MRENLDNYVVELLHIDEATKNKLIDLDAGDKGKTFYLSHPDSSNFSEYILLTAQEKWGKPSAVVLRNSAVGGSEQVIGRNIKTLDWADGDNLTDGKALNKFIDGVYKDIRTKGNNPLFLSVGEIKWCVKVSQTEVKQVRTPVLIFPVRLVRSTGASPVGIEFIDDEVYLNPCLVNKMKQVLLGDTYLGMPHPNGEGANQTDPVLLSSLSDGNEYFRRVASFVQSCVSSAGEDTVFDLCKDTVALAQYNHSDLCMYYDVKRNREKIEKSNTVQRIFEQNEQFPPVCEGVYPRFTLPRDSVQEDIIKRVVSGESLIVKGPPGTGKTLTIANMIASLIADRKRVMFISKKLSALEEVYEKVPDNLKKFMLLLDYESEAQAAKVNPSQIRKDLKSVLLERKSYSADTLTVSELSRAQSEVSEATNALNAYCEQTFGGESVGGVSYYDALNNYLKRDLPVIEFAPEELVALCTRDLYNRTLTRVEQAGKWFDELTDEGKFPVYKNPWFGAKEGMIVDEIIKIFSSANQKMRVVIDETNRAKDGLGVEHDFKVEDILLILGGTLNDQQKEKIHDSLEREKYAELLQLAIDEYEKAVKDHGEKYPVKEIESVVEDEISLKNLAVDKELTLEKLDLIHKTNELFTSLIWTKPLFEEILSYTSLIVECGEKMQEHYYNAKAIFDQKTLTEKGAEILKAYRALGKYIGTDKRKPDFFDFGAKSAIKKLTSLCFMQGNEFGEILNAASEFSKGKEKEEQIEKYSVLINKALRKELTDTEISAVETVVSKCCQKGVLPDEFVGCVERDYALIEKCRKYFPSAKTVGDIASGYAVAVKREGIKVTLNAVNSALNLFEGEVEVVAIAKAILAYANLCALMKDEESRTALEKFAQNLALSAIKIKTAVTEYRNILAKFGEDYYPVYYASGEESVGDLALFGNLYRDLSKASAAVRYEESLESANMTIPLHHFFEPFEKGWEKKTEFAHYFEHSFYALALKVASKKFNGTVGDGVEFNIEKLTTAQRKLCEIESRMCEQILMAGINSDDADFAFLAHENDKGTLRLLFKEHARAILKLKPCMVLSPSTVSVLFRPEEYESFDVVIIDEASQLEPVTAMAVAFRSKQCVIVGDEWQMPPIKHFETVNSDLDKEPSLLGLALKNNAFRAEELRCHYRSQTEALIRFSQNRYYDNMRTFPAAVPKTDELGFNDIFVEGRCVNGANEVEAKAVIERIKNHYRLYFREGKLTRTLGVVAFGEKQVEKIKSLAKSDPELKAFRHNPEVEDGFFYRAIEKVQGQEANDLILSLTYGITATGEESSSFAELNRGKLGECIFNVAVTRAQYTVTMIHSIRPEQISNEKVRFIAEYLETVERFAQNGKEQFVSEDPGLGFVNAVREYLISEGIAKERLVVGYGVTKGSVRIPLAVLDESLSEAKLGVWCELPTKKDYDFVDYNARYYDNLVSRGWKLHRIFAHDWVSNNETERRKLRELVAKI